MPDLLVINLFQFIRELLAVRAVPVELEHLECRSIIARALVEISGSWPLRIRGPKSSGSWRMVEHALFKWSKLGGDGQDWSSFPFGLGGRTRTGFFQADEREEGLSHLFDDIVKSQKASEGEWPFSRRTLYCVRFMTPVHE
jgi:hypothetical protein